MSWGWVVLVLFLAWTTGTLTIWLATVNAFIPPMIVGALIFLMFWVIRGFKKRKRLRYLISSVMKKPKPPQNDIRRAFKQIIPSKPEIIIPPNSVASYQTLEIKNESQEPK
jgi:hypothetical protein